MTTVLVLSIGESPAPCLASARHHAADHVIFFASQRSRKHASDIERELGFQGDLVALDLDDEYDFSRCYERSRDAIKKARAIPDRDRIVVDITGGTKTMTAALALAAADYNLEFAYVVSERIAHGPPPQYRQDTERVKPFPNPLHQFHVRELERLHTAWNTHDFKTVKGVIADIRARDLPHHEARFFESLEGLTNAFDAWDLFHHVHALEGLKTHLLALKLVASARGDRWIDWLERLEALQGPLQVIVRAARKPHPALLADLLANANRQVERGDYDDALGRLYRAVSLHAEIMALEAGIQIDGTRVELPNHLAHIGTGFNKDRKGRLKITGLFEVVRLTSELDPTRGKPLLQSLEKGKLARMVNKRNATILAHGLTPATETDATAMRDVLKTEFGLEGAPVWPRMPRLI
jgi:CRISPR-associated protein (TIGR02710 family)